MDSSNKAIVFLYRVLCGFFLGLSVFAPGFSGSVVAIIMGVYQDLLQIAASPFKHLKQNILYCLPLGIGAAVSAVLFVLTFNFLFDTYEKATYLLFVGLVTGNMPVIYAELKDCGFKPHYLFAGAVSTVFALLLCLTSAGVGGGAVSEGVTAALPLLAVSGFVAGAAALVPGLSVSMTLIIFGVYSQLIYMIKLLLDFDLSYVLPLGVFGVFAVAGVVLASRGIRAIFVKYPGFANSLIFGFMAGSLLGVLTNSLRLEDPSFNWVLGIGMLSLGLGISMVFVRLAGKMKADSPDRQAGD